MPDTDIVMVPHKLVPVSSAGQRLNESAQRCRYPDSVVAQVRALRRSGASYTQIVDKTGVCKSTIVSWALGRKRPEPTRFKLVPIADPTPDCTQ